MAYAGRKTFGQKAKSFLLKTTLKAAFAAAIAGTGYNYYFTQEAVVVDITSVDVTPASAPGKAPHMVIHTDRGTFDNDPTHAFFKDDKDAIALAGIMSPGNQVRLHVYGARPHLWSLTLDDFNIFRNISSAELLAGTTVTPKAPPQASPQNLPQAAPPPAAVPAQTPVQEPGPVAENVPPSSPLEPPPALAEDNMKAKACAVNANLADMTQKTPELGWDLAMLKLLPLTGQGVYALIEDPANDIQSCLTPMPKEGTGEGGNYHSKLASIGRGEGTTTAFHEWFHATQALREGNSSYSLTQQDALAADLLKEASAVAYEIATRQEAKNHGLVFNDHKDWVEQLPDGRTRIHYQTSASTDPDNNAAFQAAYAKAFDQNAGADAETREAKALEAGGKAVVRRLLAGEDDVWKFNYSQVAVNNVNLNLRVFAQNDGNAPGYAELRRKVFGFQGAVSDKINFIPEEMLGPDAPKYVDKAVSAMGISTPTASLAPDESTKALASARKAAPPSFG